MLRSLESLKNYGILATDGLVGRANEFYLDDLYWTIRYLVVDTGDWLSRKQVLISPLALGKPDWEARMFPVDLSKEQVKNSPDVDLAKPVSRQAETQLRNYYQWPIYWAGLGSSVSPASTGMHPGAMGVSDLGQVPEKDPNRYWRGLGDPTTPGPAGLHPGREAVAEKEKKKVEVRDPHLRSTNELLGYDIEATDGEIGHVEDFIADEESWIIHYMVVDTRDWLPGKKVLVSPLWVDYISWAGSRVHVDLTRKMIKDSPEFDPKAPVNREYEERLYDYYGRPKYWLRS